jgi:hypothetical protein
MFVYEYGSAHEAKKPRQTTHLNLDRQDLKALLNSDYDDVFL